MINASIHDAKTNLSKYIAAAKRGEQVYIGSHGKPEVKLVLNDSPTEPQRKLGLGSGNYSVQPGYDDHTDPDWKEIVNLMNDSPLTTHEKTTA